MEHNTFALILVVIVGLSFDFTNGFHDSANAMATSIATGALKPRFAVVLSGAANLVGAFLSLSVAATIAKGIVDQGSVDIFVVFAGLAGGVAWNVATWYFGIPSSSSHALIGGVIGATLVHAGSSAVIWSGVASKVIIPALFAPTIAMGVATVATWVAYQLARASDETTSKRYFRSGQIGTATLVSLAHGTNDAQKTMGILTLALVANGSIGADATTPNWVIVSCALAMALGTSVGGWRIIRTLGKGLIEIAAPQGFAAEATSAAVILSSSHFGIPLSTTQVCSGSVVGAGLGRGEAVRWGVFGKMAITWVVTLPAAAAVGALSYGLVKLIGGNAGVGVMAALLALGCGGVFLVSRKSSVNPNNVNDEWEGAPTAEHKVAA